MIVAQDVIDAIENFAPIKLAEKGDPTGLQIGNPKQPIKRIMTTLDVRPEVVQEAIDKKIDFIWSHHEPLFFPAKNLDLSDPQNKMYADLIKHDILVYASHTNLDSAKNGLNDWLAETLSIKNVVPLIPNDDGVTGLGRIGTLDDELTIRSFAEKMHELFKVTQVRVISKNLNQKIKKIAVLGGDGGKFWPIAQQSGADLFVTADVYYHVGHDILASDFSVIDPDHHMEAIANKYMVARIVDWFGDSVSVVETSINTDPYNYV
ncbi:Nif3-like dinuclear metal center hexameric protein [Leuconostoc palmae]|uniref:Nif3-like dinuclear metal center hexameric protein n=1 Tax=Leuconostoc palmae TaxID=501487 RepID=UPI001C7CFED9|nr:Nif3-like dinuclear metal center hexameric protein [Leuconostoc palmae]